MVAHEAIVIEAETIAPSNTDANSSAHLVAAPPGQAVVALQNSECPKEFRKEF